MAQMIITDENRRCVSGQIALGHTIHTISKMTGYSKKKIELIAAELGLEIPQASSKAKVRAAWTNYGIPLKHGKNM